MREVVAVDIGGTHARFAIARINAGAVCALDEPVTLKTAAHASLRTAWEDFAKRLGRPPPDAAAIAVAGPVGTAPLKLTNSSWIIHPDSLATLLGLRETLIVNDFEAVAHAVAAAGAEDFHYLCGPDTALPETGTITVIGPGTGLGVAFLHRQKGNYWVQATEGGHIDFAPVDAIEDGILARLRKRYRRVSVERVVSGPGLVDLYQALAAIEGRAIEPADDTMVWTAGLAGTDSLAVAAVDRFCMMLGSVAGDLSLAHGAVATVIAGGLGYRIRARLVQSGFAGRFVAKGRFEGLMASLPVKLIIHPQPGLLGAAAAFARAKPL